MKKLLLAALLAFAAPAHAGTITVTIVTASAPCNAGACTKTYTDTDANLAKIAVAYAAPCQATAQALLTPPAVAPPCTTLQSLAFWFDSLITGTIGNVTSFYTQDAITKMAPVVPINPK